MNFINNYEILRFSWIWEVPIMNVMRNIFCFGRGKVTVKVYGCFGGNRMVTSLLAVFDRMPT